MLTKQVDDQRCPSPSAELFKRQADRRWRNENCHKEERRKVWPWQWIGVPEKEEELTMNQCLSL